MAKNISVTVSNEQTLNFPLTVVNTLNTKTHSSKEMTEFSFENADDKSIRYCKQRMKSALPLSSDCVETKLCKPCTSFTSHLHNSCGLVWYRTLRVNTGGRLLYDTAPGMSSVTKGMLAQQC